MKSIICEMCGSNDLIKQDGVYVCQHCGTKYSIEEAKKLMVEVQGAVNVANIGNIENYIVMAKSASDAGNNAEAEQYCNKAIEINTQSYEAWLIKGKAAGWQSTVAKIRFSEAINCFNNAIKYAPEDKIDEVKREAVNEVRALLKALNNLTCSNYIDYPSADNADSIINSLISVKGSIDEFEKNVSDDFTADDLSLALDINSAVTTAYANTILREYRGDDNHPDKFDFEQFESRAIAANKLLSTSLIFAESDTQAQITINKNRLFILEELVKAASWTKEYTDSGSYWRIEYTLNDTAKQKIVDMIMDIHNKIKELDPSYIVPDRNSIKTKQGCYVATAVYGSYNCPEVWTLRRYRDYYLDSTWHGRLFIKLYYALSPKIVKVFGKSKWFNEIFKTILDKWVRKLNSIGLKNTPYDDKY